MAMIIIVIAIKIKNQMPEENIGNRIKQLLKPGYNNSLTTQTTVMSTYTHNQATVHIVISHLATTMIINKILCCVRKYLITGIITINL